MLEDTVSDGASGLPAFGLAWKNQFDSVHCILQVRYHPR
jgi:hypothetical protein